MGKLPLPSLWSRGPQGVIFQPNPKKGYSRQVRRLSCEYSLSSSVCVWNADFRHQLAMHGGTSCRRSLVVVAVITSLCAVAAVYIQIKAVGDSLDGTLQTSRSVEPSLLHRTEPSAVPISGQPSTTPHPLSAVNVTLNLPYLHEVGQWDIGASASSAKPTWRGNGRAIIPLLITHMRYHGTSLLATTLQGWVLKLLVPQQNIDLVLFYDGKEVALQKLSSMLRLKRIKAPANAESQPSWPFASPPIQYWDNQTEQTRGEDEEGKANEEEVAYFLTPFHPSFIIRAKAVTLRLPDYIVADPSLLNRSDWMRCGCPPICPTKRATPQYVQGTRWYTHDLFLERVVQPYSYWIKLDVDIWVFRKLSFNIVKEMRSREAIFAHTGYKYNGRGCSNELHKAIVDYCGRHVIAPVAAGRRWWQQDDNVYYSNFVVSSVGFHSSAQVMALAHVLNEYPSGFFRYRWTDQSLFHKVFGVFLGPEESSFLLDWSFLRLEKGMKRRMSVFWHSKRSRTHAEILRWGPDASQLST